MSKLYEMVEFMEVDGRLIVGFTVPGNTLPTLLITLMSEKEAIEAGEDEEWVKEFSDAMLKDLWEADCEGWDFGEPSSLTGDQLIKLIGVRGIKTHDNDNKELYLWC